jgi:hypothetical protein
MEKPKNYDAISRKWDEQEAHPGIKKTILTSPKKRCGHDYGYKCLCNDVDRSEKVFDTLDEMKLRHGRRKVK